MKNARYLKLVAALIVLSLMAIALFFYLGEQNNKQEAYQAQHYKDNFSSLDRDFWYVGKWLSNEPAEDKLLLTGETISLPVVEEDQVPYLLSKPLAVDGYDTITLKRRVLIHAASDYFAGGLAFFQTDSQQFEPLAGEKPYGEPVVLVEYAYDYGVDTNRPGSENIRVLGPKWYEEDNYALLPPLFDQWMEESLVIDIKNNLAYYKVNGREVQVTSAEIDQAYIRLLMHSYGAFTGHETTIDNIEIILTNSEKEAEAEKDS